MSILTVLPFFHLAQLCRLNVDDDSGGGSGGGGGCGGGGGG